MVRIVIENLILFLLPTLIYVSYVYLRRRDDPNLSTSDILEEAPLLWLAATGAILAVAALAFFASSNGGDPSQIYIPPGVRDEGYSPGQYR
ncbi:MAG: DUF6111 family protein [Pseudomonadota bacterium]